MGKKKIKNLPKAKMGHQVVLDYLYPDPPKKSTKKKKKKEE